MICRLGFLFWICFCKQGRSLNNDNNLDINQVKVCLPPILLAEQLCPLGEEYMAVSQFLVRVLPEYGGRFVSLLCNQK